MPQYNDRKSRQIIITGKQRKSEFRPTKKVRDEDKIRKSLHYSNYDGVLTSVSSSILGSFIAPFAIALNATNAEIGVLNAVETLGQTSSQIPGAKATEYFNRKNIWLFSRVMSRLVFLLPLILMPFIALQNPVLWLIVITFFIFFFIGIASPAWSSMMGDLVPIEIRGRYFGRRNTYIAIAGIAATIAAGYLVTVFGFPLIFILAGFFGLMAIPFFMKMYEPPLEKVFHFKHSFALNPSHWVSTMKANRGLVIFTIYLTLFNLAVNVAAPFYTVYMLHDLHFDYATFAVIITLGAIARIVSFSYWGKLNDLFGSRTIFVICASLGIWIPFLWLWVGDPFGVAIATIIDGLIFSGFDLVAFDYLLDITPADKRPVYVANHNFFVGMGIVAGSLVGGALATQFQNQAFMIFHGLQLIFLVSFALRICFLVILPKIPEIHVEHAKVVPVRYVFWKAVAVEPLRGLQHTITYSFRYPQELKNQVDSQMRMLKYKAKSMGK